MACPTCDHTMQVLVVGDGSQRSWCPRCGTLKLVNLFSGFVDIEAPKLVGRVLELVNQIPELRKHYDILGITECVSTKREDRDAQTTARA